MKPKYTTRQHKDAFLNLPGFHAGAYVRTYVEDTSEREVGWDAPDSYCANPEPRLILEIADCSNRINMEFDIDSPHDRQNSFHKIDTLIEALTDFRAGMAAECTAYKQRQRQLDELCALLKEAPSAKNAIKGLDSYEEVRDVLEDEIAKRERVRGRMDNDHA